MASPDPLIRALSNGCGSAYNILQKENLHPCRIHACFF
jgi:hypothetical protein